MGAVGRGMLRLHELIPLRSLVLAVTIFVTILVYFSTGWVGVGTLIIGTAIGLMPPGIGIRRSHAMGIILVPIMLYTLLKLWMDSDLFERVLPETVSVDYNTYSGRPLAKPIACLATALRPT